MVWIVFTLGLLLGLLIGALGGAALWWHLHKRQNQSLKEIFTALAAEQMEQSTGHVLALAQEKLSDKKEGIDQNLTTMKAEIGEKLTAVTALMNSLEKDRESKFASLSQTLTHTSENLSRLQTTTASLTQVLSNARTRGQWGERMAEDVLRLAGMQEHINYRKQGTLVGAEGGRGRPDFTFLLPDKRVLHMDVKFPLDDYIRWHQAGTDAEQAEAAKKFLAATRAHIKATSSRGYTDMTETGETPLDYLLIFIPNEQIYGFLLENDPDILQTAMAAKCILCSPTTLLAVLAVIHQAMQGFALNKQAQAVYTLLTSIQDQWGKFTDSMGKIGDKLAEAQKVFDVTTTTRRNMLDRQFTKLEGLAMNEERGEDNRPPKGFLEQVDSRVSVRDEQ